MSASLRDRLRAAMAPRRIFQAPVWGNPRSMTDVLKDVRRSMGEMGDPLDQMAVKVALKGFANSGKVTSFVELKHVCYGVTVPVEERGWRLIDDRALLDKLLAIVQRHVPVPKQHRRCYQGLLSGYFGFDRSDTVASSATGNWEHLRDFLDRQLAPVSRDCLSRGSAMPEWLKSLLGHRNLLSDDPCRRYADDLRSGNVAALRDVCRSIGISSTSWFWDQALLAYVRAVCDEKDQNFRAELPAVLSIINGEGDLRLADVMAVPAAAMAVRRYVRCQDRAEHPALRDTCIAKFGSPWVHRTAWDAHVGDESARRMVEGWLKQRLIRDFFELLAHDGAADLRRLNYWLKWEPQISDMWFILGPDAQANSSRGFQDVKKRMAGRRRKLVASQADNNAFVMRIGPLLVIEFGVTGNACYIFTAGDFKGDLESASVSLYELKQKSGATRLSHNHNWESRFDLEIANLLRVVPDRKVGVSRDGTQPAVAARRILDSSGPEKTIRRLSTAAPPAPTPIAPRSSQAAQAPASGPLSPEHLNLLITYCRNRGVKLEDNRAKGGALWVLLPNSESFPDMAALMLRWGFRHIEGKGYWLKD